MAIERSTTPRRRPTPLATAIVALTLLPLAALPATATARTSHLTCRSGRTSFKHARTRIFSVYHDVHRERLHSYYLCSLRLRRPKRFLSEAPFGEEELLDFKLSTGTASASRSAPPTACQRRSR